MATPAVTPADVQAALDTTGRGALITRSEQVISGTAGAYYVLGGAAVPGRNRWCAVTNTDNAATQAAAILVALAA